MTSTAIQVLSYFYLIKLGRMRCSEGRMQSETFSTEATSDSSAIDVPRVDNW